MKRGLVLIVFIILILFFLIFQIHSTNSYDLEKRLKQGLITSTKVMFVGSNNSQNIQKENIEKNRYTNPNNQAPVVTLISPQDGFVGDDGEIEFTYSVEDDSLLRDCYLYHDIGQKFGKDEKYRNYFVQKDYDLKFKFNNVPDGTYHWDVICTDDALNENVESVNSFAVKKVLPRFSAINDLSINEDGILSINLNDYFSDSKGDRLTFAVQSINNFQIKINNETGIVNIEPERNFAGEKNVVFTAFDEHGSKISSNPVKISVSKSGDTPPRFILAGNQEGENDSDGYVFFDCNVTDDEGLK